MLADTHPLPVLPLYVLPWADRALCAGSPDPDAWYSEAPDAVAHAVAVCRLCPVRDPCLAYAMTAREPFGVWGGLTVEHRDRIRRKRTRTITDSTKETHA